MPAFFIAAFQRLFLLWEASSKFRAWRASKVKIIARGEAFRFASIHVQPSAGGSFRQKINYRLSHSIYNLCLDNPLVCQRRDIIFAVAQLP